MFRNTAVLVAAALIPLAFLSCSDQPLELEPDVQAQFAKGGKVQPPTFTLTGFKVEKLAAGTFDTPRLISDDPTIKEFVSQYEFDEGIDHPEGFFGFFGCPDPARTCSKITVTYEGDPEALRLRVGHNPGQPPLFYNVTNPPHGLHMWRSATPSVPVDHLNGSLTVYWQGQRQGYHSDSDAKIVTQPWSVFPDLNVVGAEDDQFVFGCGYTTAEGSRFCVESQLAGFLDRTAWYTGDDSGDRAFVVIDEVELVTPGGSSRPKKNAPPPSTYIRFDVQAFGPFPTPNPPDEGAFRGFGDSPDYFADETLEKSIGTHFIVTVTPPLLNTMRTVILAWSMGADPDSPTKPDIEKLQFSWGYFTEDGCHLIELQGAYVYDTDAWTTAWDRATDQGKMSAPIWIDYVANNPSASTMGRVGFDSGCGWPLRDGVAIP